MPNPGSGSDTLFTHQYGAGSRKAIVIVLGIFGVAVIAFETQLKGSAGATLADRSSHPAQAPVLIGGLPSSSSSASILSSTTASGTAASTPTSRSSSSCTPRPSTSPARSTSKTAATVASSAVSYTRVPSAVSNNRVQNVQGKLNCWASSGTWEPGTTDVDPYAWTPHGCNTRLPPLGNSTNWCDAHAGKRILLVGDSLAQNHFAAVQKFAGPSSGYNGAEWGGTPFCDSQPRESPFQEGCQFATVCAGRVSIGCVRNDHLLDVPSRVWRPYPVNVMMHPWEAALKLFKPTHIVLNRGAHFTNDTAYEAGLRFGIAFARRHAPAATVMLRSTPPGHFKCHEPEAQGPIKSFTYSSDLPYHWGEFHRQDVLMQRVAAEEGVLFVDVSAPTRLRPDSHAKSDCLHYSTPFRPILTWIRLLAAAVKLKEG